MKKLLTLLLIGLTLFSYAQSFQLVDTLGNIYTDGETISATITKEDLNPGGEFVTHIIVENLTMVELDIRTIRTNIDLVEGMQAYVCFGLCFPDSVLIIPWTIMGKSESYDLHLATHKNFGFCKFKLEFLTPEESMTLYVEVDVQDENGVTDTNPTPVSLSAYPNPAPANSIINVSYSVADINETQNLVVRNILGSVVLSMPLNPYENKTSIDVSTLKQGVYFYAIENKNQIVIAKKLIVK